MGAATNRTEIQLGAGHLRVWRVEPGARGIETAVTAYLELGGGYVSALEEPALQVAANCLPEGSPAEIISFSHLGGVVCRWAGLGTHRVARRGLVEAAVAHACSEVGQIFRSRNGSKGMSLAVTTTLSELRYAGATVEGLLAMCESLSEPLSERMRELAAILEHSDGTLKLLGLEHLSDQLRRVVASTPAALPTFEVPERILLLGVKDLTPLHCEWLRWLAHAGADVVVAVEAQSVGNPGSLFSAPLTLLGVNKKEVEPDGGGTLAERLFRSASPAADGLGLDVVAASDRLAECEWAIRACAKSLGEGAAERDIAIAFRDEAYAPLLTAAAERLGVPVRLSTRAPLLSNRLVAFVLALMKAFASEDVRDLIPCLDSAYVGLDAFTTKVVRKALRDAHMEPNPWATVEGLVASPWLPEWLTPCLDWRREVLGHNVIEEQELSLFEANDRFLKPKLNPPGQLSAYEWLQQIRTLVEFLPILDAEEHVATGWDNRAQKAMIGATVEEASVERARPKPPMTLKQATILCEEVWSRADCSVPAAPEGVLATSTFSSLPAVKQLWVLGMSDGRFPKRPVADPVLPDWERKELQAAGLKILTSAEAHSGREREDFVRLCSSPDQGLTLSYPLSINDRESGPSGFVSEAQRIAGEFHFRVERGVVPETELCQLSPDKDLRDALEGERLYPGEVEVSPKTAAKLSLGELPVLALRQVMDAAACPFRFQARSLSILESGLREFVTLLPGLAIKANLPQCPDQEKARARLEGALDQLLELFRGQAEPWEIRLHRLQGKRYIRELIEREFAAREKWPREIDPTQPAVFAFDLKSDGKKLRVRDRFSAVGTMSGRKSLHLYRATPLRVPGDRRNAKEAALVETLLAEYIGDSGAVLEVDSRTGREVFGSPAPAAPSGSRNSFAFRKNNFTAWVDASVADAATVAIGGQMRPKPSEEVCRFCDFGELCRRSIEFSEPTSPFDDGGQPPVKEADGE